LKQGRRQKLEAFVWPRYLDSVALCLVISFSLAAVEAAENNTASRTVRVKKSLRDNGSIALLRGFGSFSQHKVLYLVVVVAGVGC